MLGRGSLIATTLMLAMAGASPSSAQTSGPISKSQRDCQTVLQCNFRRGGVYRGCISSYSCRRCRLVRSRKCQRVDGRRVCRKLVCSWS